MIYYIAPVVEGHSEQKCLERLLQRIWQIILGRTERLQVIPPFRRSRDELVHSNGQVLAQKVQEAHFTLRTTSRNSRDCRKLILILLDAEDDCPAELAPQLLQCARTAQSDAQIACVIAKRMFENWLVAGASSLAGVHGLPQTLETPEQIEDCRGAKWLNTHLHSQNSNRYYKKTIDALQFVRAFNLLDCRSKAPSFDNLCRDLETWAST